MFMLYIRVILCIYIYIYIYMTNVREVGRLHYPAESVRIIINASILLFYLTSCTHITERRRVVMYRGNNNNSWYYFNRHKRRIYCLISSRQKVHYPNYCGLLFIIIILSYGGAFVFSISRGLGIARLKETSLGVLLRYH